MNSGFTTTGIIFMIAAWSSVFLVTAYSVGKILIGDKFKKIGQDDKKH